MPVTRKNNRGRVTHKARAMGTKKLKKPARNTRKPVTIFVCCLWGETSSSFARRISDILSKAGIGRHFTVKAVPYGKLRADTRYDVLINMYDRALKTIRKKGLTKFNPRRDKRFVDFVLSRNGEWKLQENITLHRTLRQIMRLYALPPSVGERVQGILKELPQK